MIKNSLSRVLKERYMDLKGKWILLLPNDKLECGTAIILLLTLIVLWLNLNSLLKQNDLTQALNQPFCAVKDVELIQTGTDADGNVFGIYIIVKNYGNYIAYDSSYKLAWFPIERQTNDEMWHLIKDGPSYMYEQKITLMPQSELKLFVAFIQEKMLMQYVGYQKNIQVNIIIESRNHDNEINRYTCNYAITRLQSHTNSGNPFDVMFSGNNWTKISRLQQIVISIKQMFYKSNKLL